MMQSVIVDLIVILAACYVAWKYTPSASRERVAPYLARGVRALHLPRSWARRLEQKVATAGGCGSCNSCNACATEPAGTDGHGSLGGIPIKVKR